MIFVKRTSGLKRTMAAVSVLAFLTASNAFGAGVGVSAGVGAAAASNGVGPSASVGVSAATTSNAVSPSAAVGVDAASTSNAVGPNGSAATSAAVSPLGISAADITARLSGREASLWRALLKRRCPEIVSHSGRYDADLVQLCQFVAMKVAKRRATEPRITASSAQIARQ
jgi:hypothetical protein